MKAGQFKVHKGHLSLKKLPICSKIVCVIQYSYSVLQSSAKDKHFQQRKTKDREKTGSVH